MFVQMYFYKYTWNNGLMHCYTRSPTLLHNNPNMFNLSPEQRKNFINLSQNVRLGVFMTSLWTHIFPVIHFLSIRLSLFASILHVSIYLSICKHLFIYSISIWLYLTLYHSMWFPRLYLSLSLQNLATCTTCRSQFCTSQKIVSRAHTT